MGGHRLEYWSPNSQGDQGRRTETDSHEFDGGGPAETLKEERVPPSHRVFPHDARYLSRAFARAVKGRAWRHFASMTSGIPSPRASRCKGPTIGPSWRRRMEVPGDAKPVCPPVADSSLAGSRRANSGWNRPSHRQGERKLNKNGRLRRNRSDKCNNRCQMISKAYICWCHRWQLGLTPVHFQEECQNSEWQLLPAKGPHSSDPAPRLLDTLSTTP